MSDRSAVSIIKRMMVYMRPRIWKYFIGMIVMTIMFSFMSIIQSLSLKYLIEAAENHDLSTFAATIIALLLSTLVLIVFIPIFRYMYNSRSCLGLGDMKADAFGHIIKLPVRYFENHHSGALISNITNDIDVASGLYTWRLHLAIAPFIYVLFSIIPMFVLDWKISLVLLLVNVLLASMNLLFTNPVKRTSKSIQKSMGELTELLVNMLAGFQNIKLYGIGRIFIDRIQAANDQIARFTMKRVRLSAYIESLNSLIGMICNIGMITIGAMMVTSNFITFGTLITLINLQAQVNGAFLQAGTRIPQLQDSLVSAERVFDLIDADSEPESYTTPNAVAEGVALGLNGVSFRYDDCAKILDQVSISVKTGQIAALVGPSGSGKSTILKLLLGFYPPNEGNIIINGKSLGQYTLSQIRELISYVPQDPYLFYGTIEENIRYGCMDATDEAVEAAAKAACAHEFIVQQPEGYKTMVGERGTSLSGGQRQRIAIARALLKNSPILLLDEATSALDNESERLVKQAMDRLMANRTILVIAHRLSTIEQADLIYVIEEGKMVEQGSHKELIARKGLYRDLYETQQIQG